MRFWWLTNGWGSTPPPDKYISFSKLRHAVIRSLQKQYLRLKTSPELVRDNIAIVSFPFEPSGYAGDIFNHYNVGINIMSQIQYVPKQLVPRIVILSCSCGRKTLAGWTGTEYLWNVVQLFQLAMQWKFSQHRLQTQACRDY